MTLNSHSNGLANDAWLMYKYTFRSWSVAELKGAFNVKTRDRGWSCVIMLVKVQG